ncbi:putative predicted protein [Rhizobium favelukesii]|uniref:Uncharacterized protein n=1 Tax=Rhizobium favelukesii TaxID=348824 RepID=W6R9Z9_9HYPH|nr:putative predicted protein [Rhizobium favelukesii]
MFRQDNDRTKQGVAAARFNSRVADSVAILVARAKK